MKNNSLKSKSIKLPITNFQHLKNDTINYKKSYIESDMLVLSGKLLQASEFFFNSSNFC